MENTPGPEDHYVIYIRYRDGRPSGYTGRPSTSRLPSYFYDDENELGPSDCIMMIPAPVRPLDAKAVAHLIVENLNEDMTNALEVGRKVVAMVAT